MTTNVLDISNSKIATDSRWSINQPTFVLYVDNTGFDKILSHSNVVIMFAGNGRLIQEWKEWVKKPEQLNIPPVSINGSSIALCIVDKDSSNLLFEYGQNIKHEAAFFAGTGSVYAYICWNVNRNPCLAIESAINSDILSGGTVKYFDYSNNTHNLEDKSSIDDVNNELLSRGIVMYKINPSSTISINEAAKNDPNVKSLVESVKVGGVVASAPCDAMYNEWPDEKISELHDVLNKCFF